MWCWLVFIYGWSVYIHACMPDTECGDAVYPIVRGCASVGTGPCRAYVVPRVPTAGYARYIPTRRIFHIHIGLYVPCRYVVHVDTRHQYVVGMHIRGTASTPRSTRLRYMHTLYTKGAWPHTACVVCLPPHDTVSEWLRRWTRNPLGSARRGSNPLGVVFISPSKSGVTLLAIVPADKTKRYTDAVDMLSFGRSFPIS